MKGDYQQNFYNLLKTAYVYDNDFLIKPLEEANNVEKKTIKDNIIGDYVNINYSYSIIPNGSALESFNDTFFIKNPTIAEINKYIKNNQSDVKFLQILNTIKTAYETNEVSFKQSIYVFTQIKDILESTINITTLQDASNRFFELYKSNNIDVSYYIKIFTYAFLLIKNLK